MTERPVRVTSHSLARRAGQGTIMPSRVMKFVRPLSLIVVGIVFAAAGIAIGEVDDAPGASLIGILILLGTVTTGIRALWRLKTDCCGDKRQ